MIRLFTVALLATSLSACALSPQMIDIVPKPEVVTRNAGNNEAVRVSTMDQRSSPAFGTRGGIYGDTSLIRAGNDMPGTITLAVRQGLQQQGFNAYNPGGQASDLEVRIVEFSYVPEEGSVVNRVEVKTELHAVARNQRGDEFRGVYRAGNTYEQPLTPSASRNRMMLNEVLDRALRQLLADDKLLNFLSGSIVTTP
ncbi:MAG: YajG family lipoprotein [Alcanivoracaceae bacterium]